MNENMHRVKTMMFHQPHGGGKKATRKKNTVEKIIFKKKRVIFSSYSIITISVRISKKSK